MTAIHDALERLAARKPLSAEAMTSAMEAIMAGQAEDADIEAFLKGLREKGETPDEIAAAALVMRAHALKVSARRGDLVDTCGTGGDAKGTVNVSTLAALVVAAAGVPVAKHGNRSVSSSCGSADILEMLGVRVDPPLAVVESCIDKHGFGFFFAPIFHPATRAAMPARRRIQGKTIFNVLGPLSNPAGAELQLVGVYDASLVGVVAEVLKRLGARRALVVHGEDGMDEITTTGATHAAELEGGHIRFYDIKPEDLGMKRASAETLRCATKEEAKAAAESVLKGEKGPLRDIVCANAGAALYLAGKAPSIRGCVSLAAQAIDSGAARKKLDAVAAHTQEAAVR